LILKSVFIRVFLGIKSENEEDEVTAQVKPLSLDTLDDAWFIEHSHQVYAILLCV
jgi:hypothetical protein